MWILLLLALFIPSAFAADEPPPPPPPPPEINIPPDQEFCMTDNFNNHITVHVNRTSQGHMWIHGHLHPLGLPKTDLCYTQYLIGAGNLYSPAHPKGFLADFGVQTVEALPTCPMLRARVSGSIANVPIVYEGMIKVGLDSEAKPYTMTIVDCAETHPTP